MLFLRVGFGVTFVGGGDKLFDGMYVIVYYNNMTALTVTEARKDFFKLIDKTASQHEPIFIKGKRHGAVLISEEDWRSIQETIYLSSIPGMTNSLHEGQKTSPSDMASTLDW
jgi:prevent-host-death family protein